MTVIGVFEDAESKAINLIQVIGATIFKILTSFSQAIFEARLGYVRLGNIRQGYVRLG